MSDTNAKKDLSSEESSEESSSSEEEDETGKVRWKFSGPVKELQFLCYNLLLGLLDHISSIQLIDLTSENHFAIPVLEKQVFL